MLELNGMSRGVWALLPTPRLVSHKCVSHLLLNLSIWDYKTLNDKESRDNMTIYEKPLRKRGFRGAERGRFELP